MNAASGATAGSPSSGSPATTLQPEPSDTARRRSGATGSASALPNRRLAGRGNDQMFQPLHQPISQSLTHHSNRRPVAGAKNIAPLLATFTQVARLRPRNTYERECACPQLGARPKNFLKLAAHYDMFIRTPSNGLVEQFTGFARFRGEVRMDVPLDCEGANGCQRRSPRIG